MDFINSPFRARKNSAGTVFQRNKINFIEGSNISLTLADDSVDNEIDLTIATSLTPTFTNLTLSGLTQGSVLFAGVGGLISEDNTEFFWNNTTKGLAIGQTDTSLILNSVTIQAKLTVDMSGDLIGYLNHVHSDTAAIASNIILGKTKGTHGSPTIVSAGDTLGILGGYGYTGNSGVGYQKSSQIRFIIDSAGTPSTTSMPGYIGFYTTPNSSVTPALAFSLDMNKFAKFEDSGAFTGKLKIGGTTTPTNQLEIITASAATVAQSVQMFASQTADVYQLFTSAGVETFSIRANGGHAFWDGQTQTISESISIIDVGGTLTFDNATSSVTGFVYDASIAVTTGPSFGIVGIFYNYQPNFDLQVASALWSPPLGYNYAPTINNNAVAGTSIGLFPGFRAHPTFSVSNAGTWGNTSTWTNYTADAVFTGAGTTWGTLIGYKVVNASGTGSLVTQIGLDIESLTKGGTNNYAIRTGASGEIRFGNKITLYNNIATVSNGVPSELATVDLTTQAAAIGATTIYTPAATGMFRVSGYLQVTRAATTSSILGSVTITYNDGDGNVAQSRVAACSNSAGAIATTAITNTTATNLEFSMIIYARTGVAIQYAIGYTSVGATTMQYAAHLKVEAL